MSGGQIVALLCAILLLLPGGCFVLVGIALTKDDYRRQHLSAFQAIADTALLWGLVAAILALAGLLFWVAFRRRPPSDTSGSPQTPENTET
jgi:hypothetical protein